MSILLISKLRRYLKVQIESPRMYNYLAIQILSERRLQILFQDGVRGTRQPGHPGGNHQ